MKIVILGCGRVGATLAEMMDRAGHTVTIVDASSDAFQRLDPNFGGETVLGNGIDGEVLVRAGIKDADAFAAVTNGDNRNIMASQIAKEIFKVKKVVCRIYDPIRQSTYNELGLESISPTIVGAELLFGAITGSKPEGTNERKG
ncbi:MAG: TrkA family potassium uptake protein [Ktedonobacteraceae bacterium]